MTEKVESSEKDQGIFQAAQTAIDMISSGVSRIASSADTLTLMVDRAVREGYAILGGALGVLLDVKNDLAARLGITPAGDGEKGREK